MTQKEARANIRRALGIMKARIRFPRIRIKDVLEAEDLQAVAKEFLSRKIQTTLEGR